jgi:hypothetical protein
MNKSTSPLHWALLGLLVSSLRPGVGRPLGQVLRERRQGGPECKKSRVCRCWPEAIAGHGRVPGVWHGWPPLLSVRGGEGDDAVAGAARFARKRFAWELDAEAVKNDYMWQGMPVWGHAEDERRLAREEVRHRWLRVGLNEEAGQGGSKTASQATSERDPAGAIAENCVRSKKWTIGFRPDLTGIGGNRDVFHDPDQFSLWRKGWMVRDTGIASAQAYFSAHGSHLQTDAEDSTDDSNDESPRMRAHSAIRSENTPNSHTGLPLGDRMLIVALLRRHLASPFELGPGHASWQEVTMWCILFVSCWSRTCMMARSLLHS